jgi:uncharacterized membrane protein YadS
MVIARRPTLCVTLPGPFHGALLQLKRKFSVLRALMGVESLALFVAATTFLLSFALAAMGLQTNIGKLPRRVFGPPCSAHSPACSLLASASR